MKNRDGLLTFALIALVALQALALLVSYDDKAVAKRLLQKRSGVEVIETDVSRAETSEEAKQLLEEPLTEEVTPEEPKSPEGFTIREVEIAEPQQKILADAKKQITEHIINKAGYYEGGYPPPGEGLATDVIARALRSAGYDLRELMYQDMKAYPQDYPWKLYEIKTVDKNIDFRRTPHQEAFFKKYGLDLTNELKPGDPENLAQWLPGDIVFFSTKGDDWSDHVAIVSDTLSPEGVPLVIHSAPDPGYVVEADIMTNPKYKIVGHYRYPPPGTE
ncbi:uncharacterized protein HKBW3S43_00144 [Candidatus Hakubella thermalkaliphila]|uniref:DUF1287 domain-containing protein n=1 Tax=Candidatus Hakubella thermalkaliphila TaxID=2754717 RepID=A0A6V8P3K1_9ACTN|nr:DUF1287 domain-containing protein [Candidatus Hakubella thermalkaliphila]GFP27162.1 uncharacterized protein HKBW3S33_00575 [Candidatus Hakubella thermalkaliphila]GFP34351.1 uncharacterized protein HKBW3S43_00144 [Candidatus Hakubella thermalkaliphila]